MLRRHYPAKSLLLLIAVFFVLAGPAQAAKRVILMVGDGMGFKHVEMTHNYVGSQLAMEQLPVTYAVSTWEHGGGYDPSQAWSIFNYVTNASTDSASAATALSCGLKANDGNVATDNADANRLVAMSEYARMNAKSSGVVSTVPFSHATPACFASHNNSRNNYAAIAREMITTLGDGTGSRGNTPTVQVVIAGGHPTWASGFIGTNEYSALVNATTGQGWSFVQRRTGVNGNTSLTNAASATKLFGLYGGAGGNLEYRLANGSGANAENPTLAVMSTSALTVLDRDPDGFFVMIEGGSIDWAAHASNANQTIGETRGFDEAVAAVVAWVNATDSDWSDTLLIVTADHETGYITRASGQFANVALANPGTGVVPTAGTHFAWNSTGHSNSLVPLYAKGAGSEMLADYATMTDTVRGAYLDNTKIAEVLHRAVADQFHFTVTADPRNFDTAFDSVLAGMQANVGGMGAFHVMPGDIDPPANIRAKIDSRFGTAAVWYPLVGNHETETPEDMAWLRTEYTSGNGGRVPLRTFTNRDGPTGSVETAWTWEYGNACFIGLNEYWNGGTAAGSDVAVDGNVVTQLYNWLAGRLAATTKPVIFIVGHEPAYPKNGHVGDSLDLYPTQRDALWNLLESDTRVKAYLCGHTHTFSTHRQPGGRVWQIDVGNAGNDNYDDGYTFLDVTLSGATVKFDAWRESNTGIFSLAQTWSVPVNETPVDVAKPAGAKQLADYTCVRLTAVVSAAFPDFFYIEDSQQVSGIRVNRIGHSLSAGRYATVTGTISTSADGERCIEATSIQTGDEATVQPLAMVNKSVGGANWEYDSGAKTGQQGIEGGSGLNNIGLLTRVFGHVTYAGTDHFYVDDGSGVTDDSTHVGVKVLAYGYPVPPVDANVSFTGISACYKSAGKLYRLVHAGEGLPRPAFTAYNDVVWSSPQPMPLANVTTICIGSGNPGPTSGVLKDFYTGVSTGVTASFTDSGGVVYQPDLTGGGIETNSGTDAYNTFTAVGVKVAGVVYYGSAGWYVDLTFTGLDPTKLYEFTTTANRSGPTYTDRITKYTISGADSYSNTSSFGGAGALTTFCTGDNTLNGYVARWTSVNPGTDGSFKVRAEAGTTQNSAYAFSAFMLKQLN